MGLVSDPQGLDASFDAQPGNKAAGVDGMRKAHYAGEGQSLTPQQPLDPLELAALLDGHWHIHSQSGVRVFHDYMPVEFQQRAELLDLLEMELAYRRHPTFAGLGRYLHWLCRPL